MQMAAGLDVSPKRLEDELGHHLKRYFDTVIAGPAPDRMMRLAEALEQALEQGRLERRPSGRG